MTITRLLELPPLPLFIVNINGPACVSSGRIHGQSTNPDGQRNLSTLEISPICNTTRAGLQSHQQLFKLRIRSLSGSIKYSSNGPKETEAALI